ncbi:hypothetical protein GCM10010399_82170 [Dactylosporangium fulvum]|uniref:Uncharacterized protein n=1 Tax=Dactylosporangium fulvum TaxID=53359 RepID=A0ABY5VN45_9ACTN|nr:hypothetical protein [Dactylosporangium fulvum]UWP78492.1 hypothetical protein Dfulv_25245 [Dactylosporangium fulvum]
MCIIERLELPVGSALSARSAGRPVDTDSKGVSWCSVTSFPDDRSHGGLRFAQVLRGNFAENLVADAPAPSADMLHAAVDLYRRWSDAGGVIVERRHNAEKLAVQYLHDVIDQGC